MKNILVLCTGNSCRSQIAHGYLAYFTEGKKVKIYSAGLEAHGVNPKAIATMQEDNIDISLHTSNSIEEYLKVEFDFYYYGLRQCKRTMPLLSHKSKKASL